MKLKELNQDAIVKIGTQSGSSFLYTGRFRDADLPGINKYCEDMTTIAIMRMLDKIRLCRDLQTEKTLYRKLADLETYRKNYVPVYDREIIDRYPSILEDGVEIIIIPGTEIGDFAMVDETLDIPMVDENGLIRLAGAICRGMMDTLVSRYQDCFMKPNNEGIWEAAKRAELYITESNFALLKDPSYLVHEARREASAKIAKRKHNMSQYDVIREIERRLDTVEQDAKSL